MEVDIRTSFEYTEIENFRKIRKNENQVKEYLKIISDNQYLDVDKTSGKIYIENLNYVIEFKNQIISLMQAQRSNAELIDVIELNNQAFEQSITYFENSDWGDRLFCYHTSLQEFANEI